MVLSCRFDDFSKAPLSEVEKAYFEDYESPEFKWGFVNESSEIVIKPIYDDLKDMISLPVPANYKGRWGFINLDGSLSVDHNYKQATHFENDRTLVQDFSNQWLIINRKGVIVDTLEYDNVQPFKYGLAVVEKNQLKGIINEDGQEIIPLQYKIIKVIDGENFILSGDGKNYGLIDAGRNKLLELEYQKIYKDESALIRVKSNNMFAFYDRNIKRLLTKRFDRALAFHQQRTVIKEKGTYWLIDKELNLLKSLPFDKVRDGGQGYWIYQLNGKQGILDQNGDKLTDAKFDLLNKFSSDRMAFNNQNLWGYLDLEGKIIINPEFVLCWDFQNGKARAIKNRGVGFIDIHGQWLGEDLFLEVRDFHKGLARFQTYK